MVSFVVLRVEIFFIVLWAAMLLSCSDNKASSQKEHRPLITDPSLAGSEIAGTKHGNSITLTAPTKQFACDRGRQIGQVGELNIQPSSELKAVAYRFNSRVHDFADNTAKTIGILRRGTWLPVVKGVVGPGCRKGRWYQVMPRGYVCSADGVNITTVIDNESELHIKLPDTTGALSHQYALVSVHVKSGCFG
jgi:hypothetical protein